MDKTEFAGSGMPMTRMVKGVPVRYEAIKKENIDKMDLLEAMNNEYISMKKDEDFEGLLALADKYGELKMNARATEIRKLAESIKLKKRK